jgi:O-antigen/teichoic acid export membrane protein
MLKVGFKRLLKINTYILTPLILLTAIMSDLFFRVFLPEQWWEGAYFLSLMCIAGILTPISALNLNILKVKGRSDLSLRVELVKKTVQIISLIIGLNFGVLGVLYGQIVSSYMCFFINSYFSKKLIGYSTHEQLIDVCPNIILAVLVMILTYFSLIFLQTRVGESTQFALSVCIAILLYTLASFVLKPSGFELLKSLLIQSRRRAGTV